MNHRIALITADLDTDDKRMYHFMAKNLSKAGWRVEIINPVFEGRDSERIYFRKASMPSSEIARKIFGHRYMLNSLLESRADVAILCDFELLKMLPKAKNIMPIQITFDVRGELNKYKTLMKRKISFVDAVITESDELSDIIMENFGRSCTVIAKECDFDLLISLCDELEKGGRYNI